MNLAIFDLDNTLIAGDSDHSWGEFLVTKNLVDGEEYRTANDRFYQDYKAGTLDIYAFLDFSLAILTRHTPHELATLHAEFLETCVKPMMLPKAQELLQKHRLRGDYLLIITATNSFVTRPIAELLGVDDILATEPEMINGHYTGKCSGTPCFQGGKVIRLNEWLKTHEYKLGGAYFYSDSINDVPLLELVTNPVAVDPDEKLTAIAQKNGWQIMSLRN